jgi:hypothetical protein
VKTLIWVTIVVFGSMVGMACSPWYGAHGR